MRDVAPGTLTDVLLRERLTAALSAAAVEGEHPSTDAIHACAAGELSHDEALAVTRHLAACDDGRCLSLFNAAVAGQSAARDALYGVRRAERSDTAIHELHVRTRRSFRCEEAVWAAFERMAREQGRPVDALINEAMAAFSPEPLPLRPVLSSRPPRAAEPRLAVICEGITYEVNKPRFVVGRVGPASDLTIDDPTVSRQHALVERTAEHYYLIDMGSTNGVEFMGERILRKEISDGDRFRICDHELLFVIQ